MVCDLYVDKAVTKKSEQNIVRNGPSKESQLILLILVKWILTKTAASTIPELSIVRTAKW